MLPLPLRSRSVAFAGALTLLALSANTIWSQPSFRGLGVPLGTDGTIAEDLSDDGLAATGYSYIFESNFSEAFLWMQDIGLMNLGFPPDETDSWGLVVANGGVAVAGATIPASPPSLDGKKKATKKVTSAYGFFWSQPTGTISLGENGAFPTDITPDGQLVVGGANHVPFQWDETNGSELLEAFDLREAAWAVSDDGSVIVGGRGDLPVAGKKTAKKGFNTPLRWEDGKVSSLLPATKSISYARAQAVTPDGQLLAGAGPGDVELRGKTKTEPHIFRWDSSNGVELLHGAVQDGSTVVRIAPDGSVVVGTDRSSSSKVPYTPFRWTESSGYSELPFPGATSSEAYAASFDGSVVVGGTIEPMQVAWMWTLEGGMQNLQTLVDALLPTRGGDSWQLLEAIDVSDDGRVILGNGINPTGAREAWILSRAPVPSITEVPTLGPLGSLLLILATCGCALILLKR